MLTRGRNSLLCLLAAAGLSVAQPALAQSGEGGSPESADAAEDGGAESPNEAKPSGGERAQQREGESSRLIAGKTERELKDELNQYQTGPQGAQFRDVAEGLRCPTCTGLSVLQSDARFSIQIKNMVKEQLEKGKSKQEIFSFFTDRYGPWILRAPPKKGFNLLAWAFPLALLLGGPVAVWFFVWRRKRVVATHGVRPAEDIVAEMSARLDERRSARSGGTT